MDEQVPKSRFLGALIGTSVIDALGASLEGIREVEPEEIEPISERQKVLTYIDDTQLMIDVADSSPLSFHTI